MQTLSAEQRKRWEIDGYIHLPAVFDADEVGFFADELDRVRTLPGYEPMSSMLPRGHYAWLPGAVDQDPQGFMDRRDLLSYNQAFIDLIDRSPVFDLVVDIMGPWILFSMSQAIVRPATQDFPGYTHTDGGEALRRVRVTESSRPLAMKALYLLSDVQEQDSGAFTVFPGSHNRPFPEWEAGEYPAPTPHTGGAVQLTGKAGDCFLFPHSLWHGPAPNHSNRARKTLLYNYCQMFVRCYDFGAPPDVLDRCTPRQRRLLGDLGYEFRPGSYFYAPADQADVIHQRNG
ncbi:MAG: phytanoyl-CoA dioxygenase family protein [Gammaproteobacteria bacterium]|nr:phytanoyl-CoA dioxygenase family protein [Gammaproteobacteria bacterium]